MKNPLTQEVQWTKPGIGYSVICPMWRMVLCLIGIHQPAKHGTLRDGSPWISCSGCGEVSPKMLVHAAAGQAWAVLADAKDATTCRPPTGLGTQETLQADTSQTPILGEDQ